MGGFEVFGLALGQKPRKLFEKFHAIVCWRSSIHRA